MQNLNLHLCMLLFKTIYIFSDLFSVFIFLFLFCSQTFLRLSFMNSRFYSPFRALPPKRVGILLQAKKTCFTNFNLKGQHKLESISTYPGFPKIIGQKKIEKINSKKNSKLHKCRFDYFIYIINYCKNIYFLTSFLS